VVQPRVVETVFVHDPDGPCIWATPDRGRSPGRIIDTWLDEYLSRGAGCGVFVHVLHAGGSPQASIARRLEGWTAELRDRSWLMVSAPPPRRGFGEPPGGPEPLLVAEGPAPITWYDLAWHVDRLLVVVLPAATLPLDTPDRAVLGNARLRWLSARQGGLHGGLVPLGHQSS
jgi:hypothetical protein